MSYLIFPSGSAPRNPIRARELIGQASVGKGTAVISGGSSVKTATPVALGVNTQTWCGFKLYASLYGTSSGRIFVDLSFDNGVTWHMFNLHFYAAVGGYQVFDIPLRVPAGSTVVARVQATAGTAGCELFLDGLVANSLDPPGYTTMTSLSNVASQTRVDIPDIPVVTTLGSWTVMQNLATTYKAMMIIPADSSVTPVADFVIYHIGVATQGAAADSEVTIAKLPFGVSNSGALVIVRDNYIVEYDFAANQRISIRAEGLNGGHNLRASFHGLK
jgi:hypothetical protein